MAAFRDLTFSLHGLDEYNQAVDGEVFARKFASLMRGLGKSDAAVNGRRRHKFLIRELSDGSAIAKVGEQISRGSSPTLSGIEFYLNGMSAVYQDSPEARRLPPGVLADIAQMPKGAGHTFSFAEIKGTPIEPTIPSTVIRIDEFLEGRARRVLRDIHAEMAASRPFYEGAVYGSFDGVLKEVDLRGVMQKAILWLTAGGRPIECIVNTVEVTTLGDGLDKRVILYGLAHYDRNLDSLSG